MPPGLRCWMGADCAMIALQNGGAGDLVRREHSGGGRLSLPSQFSTFAQTVAIALAVWGEVR